MISNSHYLDDQGAAPFFEMIRPLLDSVPIVTAPWLSSTSNPSYALIATHIKQLKTTAPKDMRAARELRAQGRAAAKQRKEKSSDSTPKRVIVTASS